VFIPKVNTNTIGPVTKEQLKGPEPGWPAVIIERDTIGHTGTHLLKVSRRYFGSLRDEQPIILYAEWKKWIAYANIYLCLKQNAQTVKARLNAINIMHPKCQAPQRSCRTKKLVAG
jgi:hypothetical protein